MVNKSALCVNKKNIVYKQTHACTNARTHKERIITLYYNMTKHVKLQWVDVIKLWFMEMSVKAGLTAEDVLGKKKKKKFRERSKL